MAEAQVGARKRSSTKVTRKGGFILGTRMESGMSPEILIAGKSPLADVTLEWSMRDAFHTYVHGGVRHGAGSAMAEEMDWAICCP